MRRLAPVLLVAACAAPPAPSPRAPVAPPPASAPATPPAPPASTAPSLAIAIEPASSGAELAVTVVASGAADALRAWSIARATAADLAGLRATDALGEIQIASHVKESGRGVVTLGRAPSGPVTVRLTIASAPHGEGRVLFDADRFDAPGEALLPLPDAFDDLPVPVTLRVETKGLGASGASRAASSFGVGRDRAFVARGSELRLGTYLAGSLGTAVFEAIEGHDEAAWLGFTTFDPRPIAADVAAFRTAAHQLFREQSSQPMTLLIVADARPLGDFAVTGRARSVVARVGVAEPWSGPVRIAVAAAVLHRWVGGELWIGPDDEAHRAEAYWFTEGVTRGLARDLLFRFGLLSPDEMADEVEGLTALMVTSAWRAQPNAALAAKAGAPGVVPLLVARGAMHAARVDALMRAKSGGKRALQDVLIALLAKAREAREALPVTAWTDALAAELGEPSRAAWASDIERGEATPLPDGALGRCFRPVTRRYETFALGFDDRATRASEEKRLVGLDPAGPAAKAGLRADDRLVHAAFTRGRASVPADVTVTRGGKDTTIRYKPAGKPASGQGWSRRKDIDDQACTEG